MSSPLHQVSTALCSIPPNSDDTPALDVKHERSSHSYYCYYPSLLLQITLEKQTTFYTCVKMASEHTTQK